MNVLVCNDDGINSEGIIALALVLLKKGHNVTVSAPSGNRSCFAHSITFYREVEVNKVQVCEGIEGYSLSGTPADCVKYALTHGGKIFDLVCSGINHGSNLGTAVHYSGTVSACLEANVLGVKAIAFSCPDYKKGDFEAVAEVCGDIVDRYYSCLTTEFTLNVNVPPIKKGEKVAGEKITPLGERRYSDDYEFVKDNVFIVTGDPIPVDNPEDCDVEWFHKNYVSITPILLDRTGFDLIKKIKGNL